MLLMCIYDRSSMTMSLYQQCVRCIAHNTSDNTSTSYVLVYSPTQT